jgi:predicted DNA binding CopG/RHH family protein
MFINEKEINQNSLEIEDNEELEGDWDSLGDELLFQKNKFEFSNKEKKFIKKMLSESPPPLQYRRRVK